MAAWYPRPQKIPQPAMNDAMPKILATACQVDSSIFEIRVGLAMRTIGERRLAQVRCRPIYAVSSLDVLWADIIVIQRDVNQRSEQIAAMAKALGKVVIFELDDLLTAVPQFLQGHAQATRVASAVSRMIETADAVTVSTARLKTALGTSTDKVAVVPNYSGDASEPLTIPQEVARHQGASVVLASSDTVLVDFLLPTLRALSSEFAGRLQVIVVGPLADVICKEVPGCVTLPVMSLTAFRGLIGSLRDPIGIIPLDDSPFSNCKSAIKYFEYSLRGLSTICSNVPPYNDVITHGVNGLLVENTPAQWDAALRELVANQPMREQLRAAARAHVQATHTPDHHVARWLDVIEQCRHQREQLARQSRLQPCLAGWRIIATISRGLLWDGWLAKLRTLNRNRLAARELRHQQATLVKPSSEGIVALNRR